MSTPAPQRPKLRRETRGVNLQRQTLALALRHCRSRHKGRTLPKTRIPLAVTPQAVCPGLGGGVKKERVVVACHRRLGGKQGPRFPAWSMLGHASK